jgi:peptidoglycan/xylan/chitin deacetylase (PgdA/CDA1 family)
LFADFFRAGDVDTTVYGNPLVNAAFGYGLAAEELPARAYDDSDPYFPMLIGVRARKAKGHVEGARSARKPSATSGVALMYHRVGSAGSDPHCLSISEATLRSQLEWLKETCSIVPLEDLVGERSTSRPPRAIALTFDDGYADNLASAVPLLHAVDAPATFFLTTADHAFPFHYWWDRLAAALVTIAQVPSTLTVDLPTGRNVLATSTDQERHAAHWHVYQEVVRLPAAERDVIVDRIVQWAGNPVLDPRDRRMTWEEVRELLSVPRQTIGAHTVDHLFLPAQSDAVLRSELVDSRAALERLTGASVRTLAYPFGAVDERTVAAARGAGFEIAVTCADGAVRPSDDPLGLPRVEVREEPLERFIARVEQALTA